MAPMSSSGWSRRARRARQPFGCPWVPPRPAERLDALPAVGTAFDRSDISWTQARAICSVASAADECHWLDLAARHSVEDLERFVRTARAASDACPAHDRDPDADADENVIDGEP